MRFVKVIVLVLIIFFGGLFLVQNAQPITTTLNLKIELFNFMLSTGDVPFYLYFLIAFAAGALLTLVYFAAERVRLAGKARALRAENKKLEQELNSLRTMPLEEDYSVSSYDTSVSTESEEAEEEK